MRRPARRLPTRLESLAIAVALELGNGLQIPDDELEWSAIRAQGAGGQNVNKVSSALHLRFDSQQSAALPDWVKERILALSDRRVSRDGVIVIKSQRYRTQAQNRRDALRRLQALLARSMQQQKPRRPTRPSRKARQRRLDDKSHRGRLKQQRGRVDD